MSKTGSNPTGPTGAQPSTGGASNNSGGSEGTGGSRGSNDQHAGRGGRRNRNNRGRSNRGGHPDTRRSKFKGKCEEISDFVYDTGIADDSKELFKNTTREIAEYVSRNYDKAGEFRLALIQMELPAIDEPTAPAHDAGLAVVERYKLDLRLFMDKTRYREENLGKIFPLILGQCSRTIRDRLEASPDWTEINRTSDVMGLLTLIRQSLYNRATTKQMSHNLADAYTDLYKFKQGQHMSNSEYLELLNGLVEIVEYFGEEIGCNPTRIAHFLGDNANPTDDDRREAKRQAREEYIACLLITKSDPRRYEDLVRDLENQHGYPSTISHAYDMLVNFKPSTRGSRSRDYHGYTDMAFIHDGADRPSGGWQGRGSSGRGNGGRGGRGGRGNYRDTNQGGRGGSSENNNDREDDQVHVVDDSDNH